MKASLYIPCFNVAKTIRECLEAILKQTYPLKEILVIDDGSTDKTVDIVSPYPIKLIRHKENLGLAAVRNTAIRNIKTEFIAALDADCVPETEWLGHLMKSFSSPKIAGAGGQVLEKFSTTVCDLWRSVHMRQYWKQEEAYPEPIFLFGSNTVFRRDKIIEVGFYNEDLRNNYEDVDICNRLKKLGYSWVYEFKAKVCHLKNDDICSILDNYWRWNASYYQKQGYYSNSKSLLLKVKDNIGLGNRYIEEDIIQGRPQLLYLNFLLTLHHSLRDFGYFVSQGKNNFNTSDSPLAPLWFSLLDLTFFYHFDPSKSSLSTLMPKENAFIKNFLVLNLILSKFIQNKFKSAKFKKILYKHLFLSLYKISDPYLLEKLLNLGQLHQDWSGLLKKRKSNFNTDFLDVLFLNLSHWTEKLILRFPHITQMIEESAEETDRSPILTKKEHRNEDK